MSFLVLVSLDVTVGYFISYLKHEGSGPIFLTECMYFPKSC